MDREQIETFVNCGRAISKLETPMVWREHTERIGGSRREAANPLIRA